jgi:hypothetical protein
MSGETYGCPTTDGALDVRIARMRRDQVENIDDDYERSG